MESFINKNEIKNIEKFFYKNGWKPLPYQIESWEAYLNGENGTEGLVIKNKKSIYTPGRKKGLWWKYKVDPMQLDAVLIYAKGGSGIRAGLYTCLLYTSPSPRDRTRSRMPSSA